MPFVLKVAWSFQLEVRLDFIVFAYSYNGSLCKDLYYTLFQQYNGAFLGEILQVKISLLSPVTSFKTLYDSFIDSTFPCWIETSLSPPALYL